jgi:hypothetical protein
MEPWDSVCPHHRPPEDVFEDFRARRAGIVRALATDVEEFYELCDPDKENLCLYGLPDETWAVRPPDEAPPTLPEPALGINFAREGMARKHWLLFVAAHSDSWLLALAFYYGNCYGLDKEGRRQLFMMITGLPSVFEVVTGSVKKQPKASNGSSKNKSGSNSSKQPESNSNPTKHPSPKHGQISEEDNLCGVCEEHYADSEFWIACDVCEKWFHGECVAIAPAMAKHIKYYKCPSCRTKRSIE